MPRQIFVWPVDVVVADVELSATLGAVDVFAADIVLATVLWSVDVTIPDIELAGMFWAINVVISDVVLAKTHSSPLKKSGTLLTNFLAFIVQS